MDIRTFVRGHRVAAVLAAALTPVVVSATLTLLRSAITPPTAALVLVAVVVLAAASGDRAAALAAVGSAAAAFDLFLTEPYGSFAIDNPHDLEAAALLLVIGAVVTELALWGQRQGAALSRQVGYLDGVLAMAETAALGSTTFDEAVHAVARRIADVLGLDTCAYRHAVDSDPMVPTLQHDGSVTRARREVDIERDGLPVDSVIHLPVRVAGALRGRFELVAASRVLRPTLEQRRVAVLLADQVAPMYSGPPDSGGPLRRASLRR